MSPRAPNAAEPLQLKVSTLGDVTHVRLAGPIDNGFTRATAGLSLSKHVIFDMGAVKRITSFGVRAWVDWSRAMAHAHTVDSMWVINAPPVATDQFVLVSGFGEHARLLSVLAPYECPSCSESFVRHIDLRQHARRLKLGKLPSFECPSCGTMLELTERADDYALLASESARFKVPAAIANYLSRMQGTERASRPAQQKLVQGDITFIAFSGPLTQELKVRRLVTGLEGRVVFDFARVNEVRPGGAAPFVELIARASQSARVFLSRVPPEVLRLIASFDAQLGTAQIASVYVPVPCAQCGQEGHQRIARADYLGWLGNREGPRIYCGTCGQQAAPTRVESAARVLERRAGGGLRPDELVGVELEALRQSLAHPRDDEDDRQESVTQVRGGMLQLDTTPSDGVLTPTADGPAAQIELLQRERDHLHQLVTSLSQLGKAVAIATDPRRLGQAVLQMLVMALRADRACVTIRGPSGEFEQPLTHGVESGAVPLLMIGSKSGTSPQEPEMMAPIKSSGGGNLGFIYVARRLGATPFSQYDAAWVDSAANQVALSLERHALDAARQRDVSVRAHLSRYFSEGVVQQIVTGEAAGVLGGESRMVTVLFTDIRGSTALLERLSPRDAVQLLNEYFTVIIDEVLAEEGTVDKFTGDGLMAFWGAPRAQADHALRAARASLRIQTQLEKLRQTWVEEARSFANEAKDLLTGIGINSGEVVVGNIGSERRMEYTAIGDPVNVTARIQGLASGGEVLISSATQQLLGTAAAVTPLQPVLLKGRTMPVKIFRLLSVFGAGAAVVR